MDHGWNLDEDGERLRPNALMADAFEIGLNTAVGAYLRVLAVSP